MRFGRWCLSSIFTRTALGAKNGEEAPLYVHALEVCLGVIRRHTGFVVHYTRGGLRFSEPKRTIAAARRLITPPPHPILFPQVQPLAPAAVFVGRQPLRRTVGPARLDGGGVRGEDHREGRGRDGQVRHPLDHRPGEPEHSLHTGTYVCMYVGARGGVWG